MNRRAIALAIAVVASAPAARAEILAPCSGAGIPTMTFIKTGPASQNWNAGNITYTLTLTIGAFSGCTLNAPAITDTLPAAAQFVSASLLSAAGWAVGTVPAVGSSGTVNFTHAANISGPETSTFQVVVSAPSSANGTNFVNNSAFTLANPSTNLTSPSTTAITPVELQGFQAD